MQGTEPHITFPVFEQGGTMNGDGAPEFVVDPALYYPTTNNYGFYYTGFESPNDWDDYHRIFGLDGADVQYAGGQTDSYPYVYYTPTYGYGESPFNPYNPYIPGAMIGADGSYVGTQYYALSPYQNPASSSSYFPVSVQNKPDAAAASSSVDPLFDTASSVRNRVNSSETKLFQPSSSVAFTKNLSNVGSSHSHSLGKTSEGSKLNSGTSNRSTGYRSSGVVNHGPSSLVPQPQSVNPTTSHGRDFSQKNQMKMPVLISSAFSGTGSRGNGHSVVDGAWSKFNQRRAADDTSKDPDSLAEQNRGPRTTNRSKNQFVVKAYTKKAGDCDRQGNIVISADDYNKADFPLDYVHAKFFVIKSYSEDDVHKSIKYNVWSSTPNGNKKLNSAYEDAQRIAAGRPSGCPVFLYFSVNASGQFCGLAEMVGPVDFLKDMDFWQQDKWSGSFPVKWHMIKDVPNMSFRHIILENNEYKPVTNSRDTQEIMNMPGMEMLKIFKAITPRTSLLDDFFYYENRQKIMLEERARLLTKTIAPALHQMGESICVSDLTTKETEHPCEAEFVGASNMAESTGGHTSLGKKFGNFCTDGGTVKKLNEFEVKASDMISTLRIGSLAISPKLTDTKPSVFAASIMSAGTKVAGEATDVVTVGTMPVKVNGHNNSRTLGVITVGTIPIDPKALRMERADVAGKGGIAPN